MAHGGSLGTSMGRPIQIWGVPIRAIYVKKRPATKRCKNLTLKRLIEKEYDSAHDL